MEGVAGQNPFWSLVGIVSIRTKIVGIVAACIILTAVSMAWRDYYDFSAALRHQLQQRGISVAVMLASQSQDFMLTDNQFALYTMARNSLTADKDLAYVLFFDADNDILVHTFDRGMPVELMGKNQLQEGEAVRLLALKTEEGIIHDIAVPILDGQAGFVRLGMSEASINIEANRHMFYDLIWVLIVLVIGLYAGSAMSTILTKPISRLAKASQSIGPRDFEWKVPRWAKDEIGALGVAFAKVSEDLRLKNEIREQLLRKIISAQEEERKRVARELHDEAGQALTSIMMDLAQARDLLPDESTEIAKRLSRSRHVAEQTLDDLRKLIYDLRPEVLDRFGLVAALRSYVKNRIPTDVMKVKVSFHGLEERLSPEIEIILFRVIQEAITNILRHSSATMVVIDVEVKEAEVIAIIEDNGVGFDTGKMMGHADSLGLRGMAERVAIAEGALEIESVLKQGTRIKISLPLNVVKR